MFILKMLPTFFYYTTFFVFLHECRLLITFNITCNSRRMLLLIRRYGILIIILQCKMKNEKIWEKAARNFIWDKPYKKISEASENIGPRKWFTGGKLNYTRAIFEKNFALGNTSKEAVVFYQSPFQKESYTYASLLDKVSALASYLEQKGIQRKGRVLILADSKKEQVFSILALLRLGIQFGVIYSNFPPPLINNLIKNSKATHIISNERLAKIINAKNASLIKLENAPKKGTTIISPRPVSSNFSSVLYFSSGTIGNEPKIFLKGTAGYFSGINHIVCANLFKNLKKYFIFSTIDFSFGDYPLLCGLIAPLIQGGKAVFLDFKYRLNDNFIIKILEKEGVETIVSSPPFFEISQNKCRTNKIKSIILAGQKISLAVSDLISKTFTGACLINAAGSQEASVFMINFSDKKSCKSINIVRPLPKLEYKIIHKELCIKDTWPGLALPLNDKQFYLKRWRGRFFSTGNLLKKTAFGWEIIGRTDKIIKHRGRQINLEYLDNIFESQPFVQKAKCLIVENKPKLEVAVFLSLKQNCKKRFHLQLEKIIKKTIADKFGSYAQPCRIIFVKEFPTSASGKVMEKILLKKYVH
jgi:acyl-coenzyme A synthetase/AMP-(fatty) acid ligase